MKKKISSDLWIGLMVVFFTVLPFVTYSQNRTVKGIVTDNQNEPLIGVTIQVQGTAQGTITDFEGMYSLSNVPANAKLVVSYVECEPRQLVLMEEQP